MGNEMFQARLSDDFAEEVHEFRQNNYMSKSEAVRHLLRRGLEAEAESDGASEEPHTTSILERIANGRLLVPSTVGAIIGTLLPAYGVLAVQQGDVVVGSVVMVLALVLLVVSTIGAASVVIAQLALAKPLRGLVGLGVGGAADE
jgi:Arc/MetJ-type ribon-helix-helix transcriptional regulator